MTKTTISNMGFILSAFLGCKGIIALKKGVEIDARKKQINLINSIICIEKTSV